MLLDSTQSKQPLAGFDSDGDSSGDAERRQRDDEPKESEVASNASDKGESESKKPATRGKVTRKKKRLGARRAADAMKERRFVPPDCSTCLNLRKDKSKQYTRVYATKRVGNVITRYVRCDYCGHTLLPHVTRR